MTRIANNTIQVLAFDVFGTVANWHASVAWAVDALALGVNGAEFARAWRAGYQPAMARVRSGELGWTSLDTLHRMILDDLLERYQITTLDEPAKRALNGVWHRLEAWPDAVPGLTRLARGYTICTLSNGNIGLLCDMAKHAGLPWDCILSAEIFRRYKPDPTTYLGVADIFAVPAEHVLMVAAHQADLDAARGCGLRTAYIERPHEFGADAPKDITGDPANTYHARDLLGLAEQLSC